MDNVKWYKMIGGEKVYATFPIVINGIKWSNPTEQQMLDDGWTKEIIPPHVRTLEEAISEKIAEISAYDHSTAVEEFFLNDFPMWYDYIMRKKICDRIANDKAKGLPTTKLGDDGFQIELPIANAEYLMGLLEEYATQCYDKTNQHKMNVRALTTIPAVDAYDYTTGYPEKLHFDIDELLND